MTKQRQAQILKNQQEKERAKAQALEDREKIDKANRTKPKRPTAQPEDNSENVDDTESPRSQKSSGKASHPDQIKSLKKGTRKPRTGGNARVPNDPPSDPDIQDEDEARDEARERAISKKLCELEQKHEFTNAQYLKHFIQVSKLLEPTAKDTPARMKLADKMLMLPPLFDGEKPEKA